MRFVDRVRIAVRAGDGGDGIVAWRREAHVPKGGPAGGDGGSGADVVLVADGQLGTLLDLKYRQHYNADAGGRGMTKGRHGRGADDLVIRVPAGTAVYFEGEAGEPGEAPPWVLRERAAEDGENLDEDDGEMEVVYMTDPIDRGDVEYAEPLFDGDDPVPLGQERTVLEAEPLEYREAGAFMGELLEDGDRLVVALGGRGGRGNIHFRSSTNRSPDRAEQGTPGQALWIRLELKLLADVGIVGYPNVGKSTLIRKISRSRAEVGAYPFTTLTPQLGVVSMPGDRSMVVADVPGLVDGASEGKGLGHQFLRHLERTRVLLHLLSPDPGEDREPLADLEKLEAELRNYGDMFEGRPRVVALNKVDMNEAREMVRELKKKLRARDIPLFPISAMTGEGVDKLLEAIWRRLEMVREIERANSRSNPA